MSEISSESKFYIRVRGRTLGPYGVLQLQTLRKRGQFSRANEVSLDRQTWQSAAVIESLLNGQPQTVASGTELLSDSAPRIPQVAQGTREKSAIWYYSIGNERLGPVTILDLRAMIVANQLVPSDLVWKDGLPAWQAISEVSELKSLVGPSVTVNPSGMQTDEPIDEWNERHIIVDVSGMFANLHRVGLTAGLPVRVWLADRPLSLVWVQIVAFMFCFPLALAMFYGEREIPVLEAAGAISVYFALIGGAILHRFIRPEPIGTGRVFAVWFFTAIIGVVIVITLAVGGTQLPFLQIIFAGRTSDLLAYRWLYWVLAVGIVEEAAKLIPVIWCISFSKRAMLPNSAAFLGCVSGLAFGCTEAVGYSLQYVSLMGVEQFSPGTYMVVQVLRWISLPLLHAIWTGVASYLISLARIMSGSLGPIFIASLLLVSMLHGTYDFFVAENIIGAPLAVACISLLLFVGYIRHQIPVDLLINNPVKAAESRVNS